MDGLDGFLVVDALLCGSVVLLLVVIAVDKMIRAVCSVITRKAVD